MDMSPKEPSATGITDLSVVTLLLRGLRVCVGTYGIELKDNFVIDGLVNLDVILAPDSVVSMLNSAGRTGHGR